MINFEPEPRVSATPAALALLSQLQVQHGPLMIHQSGGCCDGSSPMCYRQDEFLVGDRDIRLGDIDGTPVFIGAEQGAAWAHTQLIIDVVPGRGGMFSLENGTEQRFLARAKILKSSDRSET